MCTISVIVPVYNAEAFLHRCIDSILSQTYTDFELLLIDDGSKDKSGEICDEYAQKDTRVRVFHKENGGVSSARNLGLDNAKGEWITFVDSDDWLPSKSLDSLVKEKDIDFVISGFANKNRIPIVPSCCGIHKNKALQDFIVANYQNPFLAAPWAKLFRREMILSKGLSFDLNLKVCEDAIFVSNYLLYINNVFVLDDICYVYEEPDNFGEKYSSILAQDINSTFYLFEMTRKIYSKLNERFGVTSIKSDCSIIYGLLENCILNYRHDRNTLGRFCSFLNDAYVVEALKKKKQLYVYCLLWIAKMHLPYCLYGYMKLAHFLYDKYKSFK